jgi:hypothetical protein
MDANRFDTISKLFASRKTLRSAIAGGTWAPKAGADGVYTLTLSGAAAQTIYFSDRPVGSARACADGVEAAVAVGRFVARSRMADRFHISVV